MPFDIQGKAKIKAYLIINAPTTKKIERCKFDYKTNHVIPNLGIRVSALTTMT